MLDTWDGCITLGAFSKTLNETHDRTVDGMVNDCADAKPVLCVKYSGKTLNAKFSLQIKQLVFHASTTHTILAYLPAEKRLIFNIIFISSI